MINANDIKTLALTKTPGGNLLKLFEEMGELMQAINHMYENCGLPQNRDNLIEEMADVEICMRIVRQMYGIFDEDYDAMIDRKMKRNIGRIAERKE